MVCVLISHLTDPSNPRVRSVLAWRSGGRYDGKLSNGRSIERLHELYTAGPTVGRSIGVSIERVFEL